MSHAQTAPGLFSDNYTTLEAAIHLLMTIATAPTKMYNGADCPKLWVKSNTFPHFLTKTRSLLGFNGLKCFSIDVQRSLIAIVWGYWSVNTFATSVVYVSHPYFSWQSNATYMRCSQYFILHRQNKWGPSFRSIRIRQSRGHSEHQLDLFNTHSLYTELKMYSVLSSITEN